jgi:hypothetical protein
MKQLAFVFLLAAAFCVSCSNKKTKPSPDNASIGEAEEEAYQFMLGKLTKDLKAHFSGNQTESDKVTPFESAEFIKIGIPENTGYIFYKGNGKYFKGDLNNDGKTDLIISAGMVGANSPEMNIYFIFLQNTEGYDYCTEIRADDIVSDFCDKNKIKNGVFALESIADGQLVGTSKYHKGDENSYNDFGLSCDKEKYKLDVANKKLTLAYQSDMMKQNQATGQKEKVEVVK